MLTLSMSFPTETKNWESFQEIPMSRWRQQLPTLCCDMAGVPSSGREGQHKNQPGCALSFPHPLQLFVSSKAGKIIRGSAKMEAGRWMKGSREPVLSQGCPGCVSRREGIAVRSDFFPCFFPTLIGERWFFQDCCPALVLVEVEIPWNSSLFLFLPLLLALRSPWLFLSSLRFLLSFSHHLQPHP